MRDNIVENGLEDYFETHISPSFKVIFDIRRNSPDRYVLNDVYEINLINKEEYNLFIDNVGVEEADGILQNLTDYISKNEQPNNDDIWAYSLVASMLMAKGDIENYDETKNKLINFVSNAEMNASERVRTCLQLANFEYQTRETSAKGSVGFQHYENAFKINEEANFINSDILTRDIIPKMVGFLETKTNDEDKIYNITSFAKIADSYNSGKNTSAFISHLNQSNLNSKDWTTTIKEIVIQSHNGNKGYQSFNFKKDVKERLDDKKITADDYLSLYTDILLFKNNKNQHYILNSEYATEISQQIVDGNVKIEQYCSRLTNLSDYLKENPDVKGINLYDIFGYSIETFSDVKNADKLSKEKKDLIATETSKSLIYINKHNPDTFRKEDFLKLYKKGYSSDFFNLSHYNQAISSLEGNISDSIITEVYGDKNGFLNHILEKEVNEENVSEFSALISTYVSKTSSSAEDAIKSIQLSVSKSSKDRVSTDEAKLKAKMIMGLVEATSNNKDEKDRVSKETATNAIMDMLDEAVINGKMTNDEKRDTLIKLAEEKIITEEERDTEITNMTNRGDLGIPVVDNGVSKIEEKTGISLTATGTDANGKKINWYDKIINFDFGKGNIIDIITDYGWSVNSFNSAYSKNGWAKNNNIPFCYAIEYQQLYNASISNIIQSLVGLVQGTGHVINNGTEILTNLFGSITGHLTKIAVGMHNRDSAVTPLDADGAEEDAKSYFKGAGNAVKGVVNDVTTTLNNIIANFSNVGQSPTVTESGLLNPYRLMYCVKPTNRKYCFPMLDKSSSYFKATNKMEEKDGGMGSSILGNKLFSTIANVGRTMMGIAQDLEQIAPFFSAKSVDTATRQYHIERSKYYSFPSDGEEIETSFILYNTVKQDIWKSHYKFIMGFMLRNLPYKYDVVAYYPPLFYDVHVPGVKRCPFCYVDSFDVSPLGLTRNLKISGAESGIGDTNRNYSVNVPEAWMVKVKFKSLLATSSNQILSGFIDTPITAAVSSETTPDNNTKK